MGYYRRYYTQRDYAVIIVDVKSTGGNTVECTLPKDSGDTKLQEEVWCSCDIDQPRLCVCGDE